MCQHRGSGSAIACVVSSLAGHFAHHLCAHVFELVLELDLLGHCDTVLGDQWSAVAALKCHVASLGTQRALHCVGQDINTCQQLLATVVAKNHVFSCHVVSLLSFQ